MNLNISTKRKLTILPEKYIDKVYYTFAIVMALFIRSALLEFSSYDYLVFLEPWYDFIKENGGFKALGQSFSNYSPAYLYLLTIMTYLPINKIVAIKLISIAFDFCAAILTYLIVKLRYKNETINMMAFVTVLFAPTLLLNSSVWAQCDIIYTTFLLASLYFFINVKNITAFIFYSIAFSFKLQAAFLFPLLFILLLKNRVRIWHFLIIPATYIASVIPSFIAGRPFMELLGIYFTQKDAYKELSMGAPNMYQWLPNEHFDYLSRAGMIFAVLLVATACFAIYKLSDNINSGMIIKLALFFSLLVPFVLPQMHDRYFFVADILSIAYAFYNPKYFYIPLLIWFASFFSCFSFIFYKQPFISTQYLAFAILAVLIIVSVDLFKQIYKESKLQLR